MRRTAAALLSLPLAASLLLTGCGGDTRPDASAPPATTSAPITSAPTTPPSPTATVGTKIDPNIPPAARAHTPAGAEAFVKYFHDQLNLAWGKPRAGLLAPLSLPTCKTCSTFEETAAKMVPAHERMLGDTVRIDSVSAGAIEANGDQTVVVTGAQLKTSVAANGKKVRGIPAGRLRVLATTHWTARGWRVSEIKVLT